MANYRKLSRPSDQRKALLRNQVTGLLDKGRITTTVDRAKEVKKITEKIITKAMKVYDQSVTVTKSRTNEKGQPESFEANNDSPQKLIVRRDIMARIYDLKELRLEGESRTDYRERTGAVKHPLVEKIFNEYAPKYKERAEELGQGGGYTRILKLGPRKGDGAEMAIIEFV
ncbi:MAG: 50S ribosomal protein L17 [Clostridiales bacterium]|nr:50S ribosomal protein L17 [Clostridiales bacterium]